jgi:hypothetical protein
MKVRSLALALSLAVALLAAGCGSSSKSGTTHNASAARTATSSATSVATSSAKPGPEGIPLEQGPTLAPASTTTPGATVDGIQCAPVEQLAYHIHAHLQVYIAGQPRALPGAIGLIGPVAQQTPNGAFYGAQQCYYWLHTHTSDGIIHIESPTPRIYTLGDFFDEWKQPLSENQVGPAAGKVTAYVNGRAWTKSPRDIPLNPQAVVQLDVGTPLVPFQPTSFANTNL